MNIHLPMALLIEFKNLPLMYNAKYSITVVFLILFVLYYNKKIKCDNFDILKRRNKYIADHSNLSPEYKEAIKKGHLISGMNEDEIIGSIGYPKKTQILTVEPVKSEVWIYSNGIYAYLHMGILQNWKYNHKFIKFG